MLAPPDAQLAARDSALPGLATLLDTEQLLELLKPELSLDWQQLSLSQSYIRYKQGTSCLVGFVGAYGLRPIHFYARLHRAEARDKAAKPLRRPMQDSPLGRGGLLLEKPCLLFMFFPNDHELRVMRELGEPSTRQRILSGLLPEAVDLSDLEMSVVRYKPERRCVSLIHIGTQPRYLLKAHDRSFLQNATGSVQDFQHDAAIQLRPRLASLPGQGLALYPWVPGSPLGSEAPPEQLQRVGRRLARLHDLNTIGTAGASAAASEAAMVQLGAAAAAISTIAPEQRARAEELVERIQTLWFEQPAALTDIRCRIHGDFSSDQLIINGDQICLIDFDRARVGHPIHDLGSFLARLHQEEIIGLRSATSLGSHSHALIDGYCSASRWPMAALIPPAVALHLLQLAPEAFRLRRSNWDEVLDEVLARIALILDREGEIHVA